jgi:Glu-tRNA(Gln) amidotransferase subunit E-like FAD-binding protein
MTPRRKENALKEQPRLKNKEIRIVFQNVAVSEFQQKAMRDLLKRLYATEHAWEQELGEESSFLGQPVRFEVHTVSAAVYQTGKPLLFDDET